MGAYDFMWNAVQSGQISDMDKRVEDLEKKVNISGSPWRDPALWLWVAFGAVTLFAAVDLMHYWFGG